MVVSPHESTHESKRLPVRSCEDQGSLVGQAPARMTEHDSSLLLKAQLASEIPYSAIKSNQIWASVRFKAGWSSGAQWHVPHSVATKANPLSNAVFAYCRIFEWPRPASVGP